MLNTEELRRYLAKAPRDAILDVALSPDATGRAVARVRGGDGGPPEGVKVRQLAEGVVEIDAGRSGSTSTSTTARRGRRGPQGPPRPVRGGRRRQ